MNDRGLIETRSFRAFVTNHEDTHFATFTLDQFDDLCAWYLRRRGRLPPAEET